MKLTAPFRDIVSLFKRAGRDPMHSALTAGETVPTTTFKRSHVVNKGSRPSMPKELFRSVVHLDTLYMRLSRTEVRGLNRSSVVGEIICRRCKISADDYEDGPVVVSFPLRSYLQSA